jgi:hypothetical protein
MLPASERSVSSGSADNAVPVSPLRSGAGALLSPPHAVFDPLAPVSPALPDPVLPLGSSPSPAPSAGWTVMVVPVPMLVLVLLTLPLGIGLGCGCGARSSSSSGMSCLSVWASCETSRIAGRELPTPSPGPEDPPSGVGMVRAGWRGGKRLVWHNAEWRDGPATTRQGRGRKNGCPLAE